MNRRQQERLKKWAQCLIDNDHNYEPAKQKMLQGQKENENSKVQVVPIFSFALMSLLFAFPKEWIIYEGESNPIWIGDKEEKTYSSLSEFFGLSVHMIAHIMIPYCQDTSLFCGSKITDDSRPDDVAKNILQLVKDAKFMRIKLSKTMYNLN